MMHIGIVRSYQANPTDAMTYQDVACDGLSCTMLGDTDVTIATLQTSPLKEDPGFIEQFDILDLPDPCYDFTIYYIQHHPCCVVTVWENLPWNMTNENWRMCYELARLVVARSPMTYQSLLETGCPEEKIALIPAAVDIERFKPAEKNPGMILYPGRICWEKGVFDLLFAAKGQTWWICFAGSGPALEALIATAYRHGIKNAQFLGQIAHATMPQLYGKTDVVVYPSCPTPSWQEQYGISVLEAAASGCKVVLSDQNVFRWLGNYFSYKTFVPPGDYIALRQHITDWVNAAYGPCSWSTLIPETLDSHTIGKKIREVYSGLVAKSR